MSIQVSYTSPVHAAAVSTEVVLPACASYRTMVVISQPDLSNEALCIGGKSLHSLSDFVISHSRPLVSV